MFRLSQASHIVIALASKTLSLYQGDQLIKSYPIAIGKSATPTPLGTWTVVNKKILSDHGVFGSRWIGLSAHSYGIHGTNNPNSIGTAASLGCIRLYNHDVEQLFPMVAIGTPVTITATHQTTPTSLQKTTHPSTTGTNHTYAIQAGDTLWQIAHSHHIALNKLLALNPTVNPNQLWIGQIILLP